MVKNLKKYLAPIFLTLLVFALTFIVMVAFVKLLDLGDITDVRDITYVFIMYLVVLISFISVWLIYKYIHKVNIKEIGLTLNKDAIIITIITSLVMTIGFIVLAMYTNSNNLTRWNLNVKVIYIIQVFLLFLGVGINEEILFRGYLHKFLKKHNIIMAYLISVTFFVIVHFIQRSFDFPYLLELISATILFTIIYDLSGSIWPPIILHMLSDVYLSLTSTSEYTGSLLELIRPIYSEDFSDAQCYISFIINIILILLTLLFYKLIRKKQEKRLN